MYVYVNVLVIVHDITNVVVRFVAKFERILILKIEDGGMIVVHVYYHSCYNENCGKILFLPDLKKRFSSLRSSEYKKQDR